MAKIKSFREKIADILGKIKKIFGQIIINGI